MLLDQPSSDRQTAHPVILGTGITGLAISRALSSAGIKHVLVGDQPMETPRLGESLNAEGSLEIARQFPELARFFFAKRRQALFFGGHALSFDSIQYSAGRAYYQPLGYPSTVQLLHVDRVGFDRALFDTVIANEHCVYLEDRAAALDYYPARDRIDGLMLVSGKIIAPSYVFDATSHVRFLARKLGVRQNLIGAGRRVAFAHYRASSRMPNQPLPWMHATSLLRLDSRTDPVEGLAWCIPLGEYVSVGISVDPKKVSANPTLLLDWVDNAYSRRGIDVRGAFPERGTPVDFRYEHYNHERCYGSNWLLTGPTCCQFWFPSAAAVGTGLVAARVAPAVLKAPALVAPVYQTYIDQVAASHSKLEWLVRDDPWSVDLADLQQRSQAMIRGNVKRLARYLALQGTPPELAFGDSLRRMFEGDRLLGSPLRIAAAPPSAQATRLFAWGKELEAPAEAPLEAPLPTRPDRLDSPLAILGLVEVLSGRLGIDASASLVTPDVKVQIDQFQLQGAAQWNAWVSSLRRSRRMTNLELVPKALVSTGAQWVLTAKWQGLVGTVPSISPQFSMTFLIANERVATIQTQRADYTFVAGDSILPRVAFSVLLAQLVEKAGA